MAKHWIAGAIKHPGALTKKAKAAGMSISSYCHSPRSPTTAKQCNLAKTLAGFRHK
jgi:hypothetical protein